MPARGEGEIPSWVESGYAYISRTGTWWASYYVPTMKSMGQPDASSLDRCALSGLHCLRLRPIGLALRPLRLWRGRGANFRSVLGIHRFGAASGCPVRQTEFLREFLQECICAR